MPRGRPLELESELLEVFRQNGRVPSPLDRLRSTPLQAQRALRESTDVLADLFETALTGGQARVKGMPRRLVNMIAYLNAARCASPRADLLAGAGTGPPVPV